LSVADHPLTLCQQSLCLDPLKEPEPYKAFTKKGESGVVAVFNLLQEKRSVQGVVSATDVAGLVGERFAVYSARRGFLGVISRSQTVNVRLRWHRADVYTFCPVEHGIAVLGCHRLYLLASPIHRVELGKELIVIHTHATVPLTVYSEHQVFEVRRNGEPCAWEYDRARRLLTVASRSKVSDTPATVTVSFEE